MALVKTARRRWFLVAGMAFLGVVSVLAWRLPADESAAFDEQPLAEANAAPENSGEAVDVTDKVEVTVNGGLRSTSRTEHVASVTVKNISDADLEGPLVLVVDETGIEGLTLLKPDGKLASGEEYAELLGERGALQADRPLRAKKIDFATEEPLTGTQRGDFALAARVLQLKQLPEQTSDDDEDPFEGKKYTQADMDRTMRTQEQWTTKLMQRGKGNVYGTGVGEDENGNLTVRVYTHTYGTMKLLPGDIDGVPLEGVVTGTGFLAGPALSHVIYPDGKPKLSGAPANARENGSKPADPPAPEPTPTPADGNAAPASDSAQRTSLKGKDQTFAGPPGDPTIRFPRPVPIGVSTYNAELINLFPPCNIAPPTGFIPTYCFQCSAGTIGAFCFDALGNRLALSNNHVWGGIIFDVNDAADPDPFDDVMLGIIGSSVSQPGNFDAVPFFCNVPPTDFIGTLADFEFIWLDSPADCVLGPPAAADNFIDAAVISTSTNDLQSETPDDGYGSPKRNLATIKIGMEVQKYGRTSVYSRGRVTGMNVIACVIYWLPPPGQVWEGRFVRQLEITSEQQFNQPFSRGGDSGSLIVVRGGKQDRKPVGLLFAGSSTRTLANPFSLVQSRFNLQVDDGSGKGVTGGVSGSMGGAIGPLP